MNLFLGFDEYQYFEAANELIFSGISRLSYLPNSSVSFDIVDWGHLFTAYLYAVAIKLFDIQFYDLAVIHYIEFVFLILVLFKLFCRFMSRSHAFMFTCLLIYEPMFNRFYVDGTWYRWSFIFAILSILCFLNVIDNKGRMKVLTFSYLAGFFACMAPFSFASQGVPIFIGLALAFLSENIIFRQNSKMKLRITFLFILGILTPMILFGVNILSKLDKESIYNAYYTIAFYGDTTANKLNTHLLYKAGYFIATLIVSPYAIFNFLPVGIAAMVINVCQLKHLRDAERNLLRVTIVFTGVWIILAMFMSTHMYSGRMIWIMPFYFLQIIITVRLKSASPSSYYSLIAISMILAFVQGLYYLLDKPGGNYGIGCAAVVTLMIALVTILVLRVCLKYSKLLVANLNRIDHVMLYSIVVILLIPVFLNVNKQLFHNINYYLSEDQKKPVLQRLSKEVRKISEQELKPGDRVLTNAPMREFFQKGVKRQCIFFYRGLFSGATEEPADKVFLIGTSPDTNISDYRDVKVGKNIYYRGFDYHIEKRVELLSDYYLLIGGPFDVSSKEKVIYPTEYVSKKEVDHYLNWRDSEGLSVR